MKTLLFAALLVLVAPLAWGAPFLVADPPSGNGQITHYKIYKDAVLEGTSTGEVLSYDLVGVTPGEYDWTAEACNVWGCSSLSDPYISPSQASPPSSLNVIP